MGLAQLTAGNGQRQAAIGFCILQSFSTPTEALEGAATWFPLGGKEFSFGV